MRDRQGLLAHPFRGQTHSRDLIDVIAQAAVFDHLGQHGQDAGVVHARAHVQHRRDADRLADFPQARADF